MKILIISAFLILFFSLLIWMWKEYRKKKSDQRREYEIKYKRISHIIEISEINHQNYVWIFSLLRHLRQLQYRNHEKTEVLLNKFLIRFQTVVRKENKMITRRKKALRIFEALSIFIVSISLSYGQPVNDPGKQILDTRCGLNHNGIGKIINLKSWLPKNIVYLKYLPIDDGKGIGYIRRVYNPFGAFITVSRGKYSINMSEYEIRHYKTSLGIVWYAEENETLATFFYGGGSYHWFNNYPPEIIVNIKSNTGLQRLNHLSCELGCGMRVGKRFTSGFDFDFIRDESCMFIGIAF